MRLHNLLAKRFPGVSKKRIKQSIDAGCCRVNGRTERFASRILASRDKVDFFLQREKVLEAPRILLDDDHIRVIDKPSGLACEGEGLVHRLDKETSGVLILAKTPLAKDALEHQFRARTIEKTYIALVEGEFPYTTLRLHSRIGVRCRYDGGVIMGEKAQGKEAVMEITRLRKGTRSLLACRPVTGRTHQIRVQLAAKGFPIVGDPIYGTKDPEMDRLQLHALTITFHHPVTQERLTIRAEPCPVI